MLVNKYKFNKIIIILIFLKYNIKNRQAGLYKLIFILYFLFIIVIWVKEISKFNNNLIFIIFSRFKS